MNDATLRQGNQILDLILQANDPKRFSQNLIENWGAVQRIGDGEIDQATFQVAVKDLVNPFANEKRVAALNYPQGWALKHLGLQVDILSEKYYPDLDKSHVVRYFEGLELPDGADPGRGVAVFPKLSVVARLMNIADPFAEEGGYGELLEKVLCAHLDKQRAFRNWRKGELKPNQVRMRESTRNALRKLEEEQPEGDFLVVPVQTGRKYGGYSVRNARWEMEHGNVEFPLPSWVVGHILITHPDRLEKYEHLCIDCPGDEYRFQAGGEFEFALCFYFSNGRLHFRNGWIGGVSGSFGSASGFLR